MCNVRLIKTEHQIWLHFSWQVL